MCRAELTSKAGVCECCCNVCGVGGSAGFIVGYCCLSEGHIKTHRERERETNRESMCERDSERERRGSV